MFRRSYQKINREQIYKRIEIKADTEAKLEQLERDTAKSKNELQSTLLLIEFYKENSPGYREMLEKETYEEPTHEIVKSYATTNLVKETVEYTGLFSLVFMFFSFWGWVAVVVATIALLIVFPQIVAFLGGLFIFAFSVETLFTKGEGYDISTREI